MRNLPLTFVASLTAATVCLGDAPAKPKLSVSEAMSQGPYRVMTAQQLEQIAKQTEIDWPDTRGMDDVLAVRITIGLNQMASDGWRFKSIVPPYSKHLGGAGNARIHFPPVYIFERLTDE